MRMTWMPWGPRHASSYWEPLPLVARTGSMGVVAWTARTGSLGDVVKQARTWRLGDVGLFGSRWRGG